MVTVQFISHDATRDDASVVAVDDCLVGAVVGGGQRRC